MLSFSAFWVGSNLPICSQLQSQHHKYLLAKHKGLWLQRSVALLINAEPDYVKVLLGSPTGPELTPRLQTVSTALSCVQQEAVEKAWNKLKATSSNVVNVYVTHHAAADVAIDRLVHAFHFPYDMHFVYDDLAEELRGNPKVAIAAIRLDVHKGIELPLALSQNKQFLLSLAKACGNWKAVLQYAHSDLRKDKDLVLAVIPYHSNNISFAARELLKDKDVVLAAMQTGGGYWFESYDASFANDRDVVLAAVLSYGNALAYVHPVFRNDKEVVQAALYSCYGEDRERVLQFASSALQHDSDVLALIK